MPVQATYRPDPMFATLGPEFADPVAAARFPQQKLRRRNQTWAHKIGLGTLTDEEWAQHFHGFAPLPDNQPQPLAMRYHGHQFRVYNPDIGDGRGFLFGQLRDDAGRLLDLGTKGSGQTPYSRFGDGKLTLKGGVREVLAAEMLEALGVYTSKALSLFETGEDLVRGDEPSPTRSSVLVRLSHSHVRFGTFQRLAFFEKPELMHQLVEHVAAAYYPDDLNLPAEARVGAIFANVVEATGKLAASWMAAGFVHGVLNTDNLNVTGESFDYGPWRFLPTSDPDFTAAYFDETGLYAFARQPEAVSWALSQLGGALTLICPPHLLETGLANFPGVYQMALRDRFFARLNLTHTNQDEDLNWLQSMLDWLTTSQVGFDQFFHDWYCGEASAARAKESPQAARYAEPDFAPIRAGMEKRTPGDGPALLRHSYLQRPTPVSLVIDEVETLWAPIAERDDWSGFEKKLSDIAEMRGAMGR